MLGLVFFGLMKRENRNIRRDEAADLRADHARRVSQAFENVETDANVRPGFRAACFESQNHSDQAMLTLNEEKLRDLSGDR
jgi:hypothetical protein